MGLGVTLIMMNQWSDTKPQSNPLPCFSSLSSTPYSKSSDLFSPVFSRPWAAAGGSEDQSRRGTAPSQSKTCGRFHGHGRHWPSSHRAIASGRPRWSCGPRWRLAPGSRSRSRTAPAVGNAERRFFPKCRPPPFLADHGLRECGSFYGDCHKCFPFS